MPTPFHIAPASTATDIAAAASLFRAYAAALPIDLAYQDFAAELATLPGRYAPPHGALLLARTPAGEPIGCAALRNLPDPGLCEIKRLYVAPPGRRTGLGRALLDAILAAATTIGYREIRLDTLPTMAEAAALYRRAGFTPIAPYYPAIPGTLFFARPLP